MQYAGNDYLMKILCVFVSYSTKRGKQLNSQLLIQEEIPLEGTDSRREEDLSLKRIFISVIID